MTEPRDKQAAVTCAHSKVKIRAFRDPSRKFEGDPPAKRSSVSKKKPNRGRPTAEDPGGDHGGSKSSFVFEFDTDVSIPCEKQQPSAITKIGRPRKREGARRRQSQVDASKSGSKKLSPNSSVGFSGSSLSSASEWNNPKNIELEMLSMEKARMEHQHRRSLRLVNSTGPMLLSYRTSYRIGTNASPMCSPITSCRLRFTPVAHLPTSPIPTYSHGYSTK
jgi:hypothetical protein